MNRYRTTPLAESTAPKGIPYIIANEAAERFSFYGMRAILVVFMTQSLVHANGQADYMSADEAIKNEDSTSKLAGADYFWFFTLLMLITAVAFIFVAKSYKDKTYIQKETLTEKSAYKPAKP